MRRKATPKGEFRLRDLLASNAERMRVELELQLIDHPGELGRDREKVIRAFLRKHLPKRFTVSTGFVFDATGKVSEQIDVIIADALVCPVFKTAGGVRFFPCEAVVAAGQVKSSMTSESVMREALENLETVKDLDRSAGAHSHSEDSDEPLDQLFNHKHQIFTFLFVTGRALVRETAQQRLMEFVIERSADLWPNVVIAPNKYLLTYCCEFGVCANPLHAYGVAGKDKDKEADLVMRFYLLLAEAINVTVVARLPYRRYLEFLRKWNAEVFYAATDDPPPLLSQVIR